MSEFPTISRGRNRIHIRNIPPLQQEEVAVRIRFRMTSLYVVTPIVQGCLTILDQRPDRIDALVLLTRAVLREMGLIPTTGDVIEDIRRVIRDGGIAGELPVLRKL